MTVFAQQSPNSSSYICAIATIGADIRLAASLLEQGKLVGIPTETVYGLAVNALNEKAVLSVFEVKQRPFFDPLIVHIHDLAQAEIYAEWNDDRLKKLARNFWPGPVTILLPKKNIIPDMVTSGLPQVALRVPAHPLTQQLLKQINFPLAAPSANPFGYVSPTQASHVDQQLGGKIEYILDGGPCEVGLESTIIGKEDDKICIYRLGGLPIEEIEKITGNVELRINLSGNPDAPGQLKSHYAPKKPLIIGNIEELIKKYKDKKIAVLFFGKRSFSASNLIPFQLSASESLNEAAINLFHFLREADASDAELVLAEFVPNKGLGRAINDRLKRAAV